MAADVLHNNRGLRTGLLVRIVAVLVAVGAVQTGLYVILFTARGNFREVVPGKVYRCGQPSIEELGRRLERYEIATLVNLRGGGELGAAEKELCGELGVEYVEINLSAYLQLSPELLRELTGIIDNAEWPLLMHCQAGVDRAGTASAMAAMAIGGEDFSRAKWQAYVPPGPWKRRKRWGYGHISDVLVRYERDCKSRGLNTAGWEQFKGWAAEQ